MNKRAIEVDSELDQTRTRIRQTVKDINTYLSPMAMVTRNFDKITSLFTFAKSANPAQGDTDASSSSEDSASSPTDSSFSTNSLTEVFKSFTESLSRLKK